MLKTEICDLLGIEYPIIQGGMAHIGTAELVSAVSEAGGLGIVGAGFSNGEWVRQQIHLTRERTSKPFGVNLVVTSPHAEEVIEVALEERVAVVTFGAGNPGIYISRLKEAGVKVMPVVAGVALARRLEHSGADAIVAEGMESGGEIGETTTMVLIPQIVDAVRIPVLAAGGIADGRGLAAALALGARGIQMGTRFICSTECIAHPKYKEQILKAGDRSTTVSGRRTGYPMRSLRNPMTHRFHELEESGASAEQLAAFGKGKIRLGLIEGNIEEGSLLAGQIAGLIKDIKPVKTIIRDIMTEAEKVISGLDRYRKV